LLIINILDWKAGQEWSWCQSRVAEQLGRQVWRLRTSLRLRCVPWRQHLAVSGYSVFLCVGVHICIHVFKIAVFQQKNVTHDIAW